MPTMYRDLDPMSPKVVLFSLLAATGALAGAVCLATLGQGLGGVFGGCAWIGASTPIDRQVWALVNQPTLNFSSTTTSLGYWMGSYLLPLLVASGAVSLLPRARSLAAELVTLHWAWAAAVVGVAWMPLVDLTDGHLARWLDLWDLPPLLIWLAPVLALPAAAFLSLRLLSMVRVIRHQTSRGLRLAAVTVHFVLPAGLWVGLATTIRGGLNPWPSAAVGAMSAVALVVAWFGYPPAYPHRLEPLGVGSWIRVLTTAVLLTAAVGIAGGPSPRDQRAGILWARPGLYNNIRSWIETTALTPGARTAEPIPENLGSETEHSAPESL